MALWLLLTLALSVRADNCVDRIEHRVIKSKALPHLFGEFGRAFLLRGYYDCHEVHAGDIVAFTIGDKEAIYVRIVKAVPGDRIAVVEQEGAWRLLINDVPAENSDGRPFKLNAAARRALSKAERKLQGVVPAGKFIILGNRIDGGFGAKEPAILFKDQIVGQIVAADVKIGEEATEAPQSDVP
jgi:hypothetical protein